MKDIYKVSKPRPTSESQDGSKRGGDADRNGKAKECSAESEKKQEQDW